jgi:hypothetical protein
VTWVLILVPVLDHSPPAVIGGYRSRDDAEAAGWLAIRISEDYTVPRPPYHKFLVIPGAADCEPTGSICGEESAESDYSQGMKRIITRSVARYP